MRYSVAIEPGDDGHSFGVVVPDLPGCFSAGDTLDEAIDNVHEVIGLWLETVIGDGGTGPRLAQSPYTKRILNLLDGFGL